MRNGARIRGDAAVSPAAQQVLLYVATIVILGTTLVVFVVQFVRMRRRDGRR